MKILKTLHQIEYKKNIKYAASTQRRVLANLYNIKNEGTKSIS